MLPIYFLTGRCEERFRSSGQGARVETASIPLPNLYFPQHSPAQGLLLIMGFERFFFLLEVTPVYLHFDDDAPLFLNQWHKSLSEELTKTLA